MYGAKPLITGRPEVIDEKEDGAFGRVARYLRMWTQSSSEDRSVEAKAIAGLMPEPARLLAAYKII